ncbi:MAG: hypothetical protein LBJ10_06990 [Clostridiales bacterium]|jgi:hypothetical protein|nr:hypothetical protein [Clostridiales bacterium]
MDANREYKSSVFARYFSDREKLIEAYNAIEGTDYPMDAELSIETLEGALFLDQMNDVAFLLDGKLVVLIEHQSTVNANMPLRALMYIGRVYERLIESRSVYREKLVRIPRPEFIVLYNGKDELPDMGALSLSDAYLGDGGPPALELKVKVYNINHGRNPEILGKSKSLSDYAAFMARIRANRDGGAELGEALKEAIRHCIACGIMKEYLEANGSEVENMLFTEFNMDDAIQVWKEEGFEDGIEKGREEGIEKGIEKGREEERRSLVRNMHANGMDGAAIAKLTGYSLEDVQKWRQ